MSESELQELAKELVDEFNAMPDYQTYKRQTFDKYGIGIVEEYI